MALLIFIWPLFLADKNLSQPDLANEPIENESVEQEADLIAPVKEFESRITKKPFGIFITPETSPVQPERFRGYHTGVDVEYDDVEEEVPVRAMADGLVEYSGWVSGYGGLVAIRHLVGNQRYLAIYGHLNPTSLVAQGQNVVKGEQIGILGRGNTSETDGERKHLHFALYLGGDLNLAGYVDFPDQLSAWLDPMVLFSQ